VPGYAMRHCILAALLLAGCVTAKSPPKERDADAGRPERVIYKFKDSRWWK